MSIQNLDLTAADYTTAPLFPRILVVEPDPAIGEMLCELFDETGYECKLIRECSNIIPIIESFRPDLVLIEYLLPIVNGGELCSQIKQDKKFSVVPVIMYSAYPQILWSVEEYGCDQFITKPFDMDALLIAIEKLLVKGKEQRRFSLLADTLKNRLSYLGKFLGAR